jgi:predicted permease
MIRDGIRRAMQLALHGRHRWEREVEEEIRLHLTLRAEQLANEGLTPAAAFDEAVRRFGPLSESRARLITAARNRDQRMQRAEYFADLRQDLAFAVRTLRRDAGWTAVTVLTLALGIAATTAVFSVVSSLLLHAVSYPDADRVMLAYQQPTQGNTTGISVTITPSMRVIRAWKASPAVGAVEAYSEGQTELRTTGEPVSLQRANIEPTFPAFAGLAPIAGRMFSAEDIANGGRVALLGEGMWRTRFGGESSAIGKTITLDDSSYTVIGVLPAKLHSPTVGSPATDVWLPMDVRGDAGGAQVVVRLRPGISAVDAARALDTAATRALGRANAFNAVLMAPSRRLAFRDSLVMLAAAVALVLLVACANVAHLLMARSANRRRELAIRVALGAGRGRVFRQLLTEAVVLATSGGILGVVGGWLGLKAMVRLRPGGLDALTAAHIDATTLGIAVGVTAATSLVFGLVGAVQAARASTSETLKAGGGAGRVGRGHARQLLVITEMALSATLIVGATMLIRSVINLQHADLGFDPNGLYAVRLTAPKQHFASAAERGAAERAVLRRVAALPGVQSTALASTVPGWFAFSIGRLEIDGLRSAPDAATSFTAVSKVGSGYFRTMGIRLVQGTGFSDTAAGRQVIINERFARKQWNGVSPIGHRIRVVGGGDEPWLTIVGVAAEALTGGALMSESTAPMLYTPAADSDAQVILLRARSADRLLERMLEQTKLVDAALTPKLDDVHLQVSAWLAAPRFVMLLLTAFTVLALALAAVGLYGVMAYTVAQRTREIGIRMALGATRSAIARRIVMNGVILAGIGGVIGAAVSVWGTKLIEHQLYGVAARDVVSMIIAGGVLFGAAVLACVVPARRALGVDPVTAIRAD